MTSGVKLLSLLFNAFIFQTNIMSMSAFNSPHCNEYFNIYHTVTGAVTLSFMSPIRKTIFELFVERPSSSRPRQDLFQSPINGKTLFESHMARPFQVSYSKTFFESLMAGSYNERGSIWNKALKG
jgi:hypothetical protein